MTADQEKPTPRRRPAPARRDDETPARPSATTEDTKKQQRGLEKGSQRESTGQRQSASPDDRPSQRRHGELSTTQLAQSALSSLRQLTTREIEAVVGISRKDNANVVVTFEVVESHHFPDSSDVMAEYVVEVDPEGELVGYHRGDRYQRGRTGQQS